MTAIRQAPVFDPPRRPIRHREQHRTEDQHRRRYDGGEEKAQDRQSRPDQARGNRQHRQDDADAEPRNAQRYQPSDDRPPQPHAAAKRGQRAETLRDERRQRQAAEGEQRDARQDGRYQNRNDTDRRDQLEQERAQEPSFGRVLPIIPRWCEIERNDGAIRRQQLKI